MKKYGITGTLFISGGKYKWSQKYEHCIACRKCDFKHKGRGLCTSCFDKERNKKAKRKTQKRRIAREWSKANYIPKSYDTNENHRKWYEKRKEIICLLQRGRYAKETGKPVIQIGNKFIPYMDLNKNFELFDKVRNYILKP